MNILKKYDDIVKLLEANQDKKIKTLMPQIYELTKSKREVNETVRFDESGAVTEVFCYYHKVWENVADVEFGVKTNTKSGLNTMCKDGMKAWTKTNNSINKQEKEMKAQLVQDLLKEAITREEYAQKERQIPDTIQELKDKNNGTV